MTDKIVKSDKLRLRKPKPFYMWEFDLTREQLDCKASIGTEGLYRMYRWECPKCNFYSVKMIRSDAMKYGLAHEKQVHRVLAKHRGKIVSIRGGNFPLSDLGKP